MNEDRIGPGARDTDPVTSHQAAAIVGRRPNQRWKLLRALHSVHLGDGNGLTVDEATRAADLPDVHQRWSELMQLGAIDPVRDVRGSLVTRLSNRGSSEMVCGLTPFGIRAVFDPMLVSGDMKRLISVQDAQIRDCTSIVELRKLWGFHHRNGTLTSAMQTKLQDRARKILGG